MITIRFVHDVYIHPNPEQESDTNKLLRQILNLTKNMPTKAEFQAIAQEFRDAFLNISNDITRLTNQLAAGGMTDAEEAEVLEEFRTLAADAKALADKTPEAPPTPEPEPGQPTG